MNLRKMNAWISLVTSLIFLYAMYNCMVTDNGLTFSSFRMFEVICMAYGSLYYLLSFRFLRKRRRGVFIPVLRYSVFVTISGWCLYGLIFLPSYYRLFSDSFQKGITVFRYGVVLMLVEWLISEKGHFWKQFTWSGVGPVLIYSIVGMVLNNKEKGIDLNGHVYPYMDAKLLGWKLAVPMAVLLFVEFVIYARVWVAIDRGVKEHEKV